MRDPRVDPHKGDIVRDGLVERKFIDGPYGTGKFVRYRQKGHGNVIHKCVLESWRKWAKYAEVIHVAGEKGKAE